MPFAMPSKSCAGTCRASSCSLAIPQMAGTAGETRRQMTKKGIAMSNETDLDWLARTYHHWPKDAIYVSRHENAVEWHYVELAFKGRGHFTKDQWLGRRAELQNKPSWDAVPNHANWLTQDAAGTWLWHSSEPECRNGMWLHSTTKGYAAKGSVLGDWLDTLERRPEEFKPSIEEANRLAQEFKAFTSIEDNQEQEMKQDNGWFERGELPPVGTACEIHHQLWSGGKYEAVKISEITKDYLIVEYERYEQHYLRKGMSFRHIRTERDLAIDEMMKVAATNCGNLEDFCDALYRAGYRKESK